MTSSKIKAFLIILSCILVFYFSVKISKTGFYFQEGQFFSIIFYCVMSSFGLMLMGIHKPIVRYFNNKYYNKQDELNFQTNLRRGHLRIRTILYAKEFCRVFKNYLCFSALHTTKKQKSLIKQWHNSNFSDELKPCQTLSD